MQQLRQTFNGVLAIVLLLVFTGQASAAVVTITDGFDDGNYTSNPAWDAEEGVFSIINSGSNYALEAASGTNYAISLPLTDIADESSVDLALNWRHQFAGANQQEVEIMLSSSVTGDAYTFYASPANRFGPPEDKTGFFIQPSSGGNKLGPAGETLTSETTAFRTIHIVYDPSGDQITFTINEGETDEHTMTTANFEGFGTLDTLTIHSNVNTANHYIDDVSITYNAIPEPGSFGIFALMGGLLGLRRQR